MRKLMLLALLAMAARADTFVIEFTATSVIDSQSGNPDPLSFGFQGTGHLATDGVCLLCNDADGVLEFVAVDMPFPIKPSYDLHGPEHDNPFGVYWGGVFYDREENTLHGAGCNFLNRCLWMFSDGTYYDDGVGLFSTHGDYAITQATPEPSSVLLLTTLCLGLWPLLRRRSAVRAGTRSR